MMEREMLESLFEVFDTSQPKGLNSRFLLDKVHGSEERLQQIMSNLTKQGYVREVHRESRHGYIITLTGARHYLQNYFDVDATLKIEELKDETLEAVAMELGNNLTGSEIRRFLESTKIPNATIGSGTKWKSVYALFRRWNRPLHCLFIIRVIQRYLEPARFINSAVNRSEVITRLNRYLQYDGLRIDPSGRVVLLGSIEVEKKDFVDAVSDNEAMYITEVILPLLRRIGFSDVVYSHGHEEYGRDLTFSKADEFGLVKHYAAQVKVQIISGEAGALIDKIVGQIDDAFLMPYIDLPTKEERYISAMYIITSSYFTKNATAKIIERVQRPAIRNNVFFLDGEKIKELWRESAGK
jgi:predicted transcriptional regulator